MLVVTQCTPRPGTTEAALRRRLVGKPREGVELIAMDGRRTRSLRSRARIISSSALLLVLSACSREQSVTAPAILGSLARGHNAPVVTVVDLGALDGGGRVTSANGINNRGDVVGGAFTGGVTGRFVAYEWTAKDGAVPLSGTLGFEFSVATDINEPGDIVGSRTPGPGRGLLWTRDGLVIEIPELTIAHAINNRGAVVGSSIWGTAALWTERDGVRNLGGFNALDINDRQDVVGQAAGPGAARAAIWPRAGTLTLLPTAPAFQPSQATGINDRGEVVGFIGPHFNSMGFVWSVQEGLRMLETPLGLFSHPEAINNQGEIAGWLTTGGSSGSGRAVMWTASGELIPLDALTPGGSSQAFGINDRGEIVGVSSASDPSDPTGSRGVLWTVRRELTSASRHAK